MSVVEEIPINCILCNLNSTSDSNKDDVYTQHCRRCGEVVFTRQAMFALRNEKYNKKKYLLSGITRFRTDYSLEITPFTDNNIDEEPDQYFIPRKISQKLDLVLKYISKKSEFPGARVPINPGLDYTISFSKSANEIRFYLKQLEYQKLINKLDDENYELSIEGWNRLDELERNIVKSNQAFIAMWFDESMNEIYNNGFQKAILDSKFEPMKINMKEHNNKIDDEIIAEIRNSRFLVADFTGQRGGVYYEAGFAHGLGIPVIWTCRKSDFNNLHFDTRQYNHIEWEYSEDLYKNLLNRIKATITIKI